MKTKLLLIPFITVMLFMSVVFEATADEKPSKVIISFIEDIPPSWFRDADGTLQGMGPDYWRLWGKKLGVEVVFKTSTWQGSLDAVQNGEADFHSGMVSSDERKEIFDFASTPTVDTEEFIYVRSDLNISVPSKLDNIPVWTDGGISETILKEKFPELVLLNANGYSKIDEMIRNKTVGAFVMDQSIAVYTLAKLDATGRYKKIYSVFKQPLYAAVKKGNSEILDLINDGHNMINTDEIEEINDQYIATRVQSPVWLNEHLVVIFVGAFIFFLILHSLFARAQIKRKTKALMHTLAEEQKLRLEKERLLIKQSRMAQLGEMINSMTHQWKQPLNTISIVADELADVLIDEDIDKERVAANAKVISDQVQFMSNTMDDFSGFTSPKDVINDFYICEAFKDALRIVEHTIKYNNVKIDITCGEKIQLHGAKNELMHVIINLISNSIDAFINRKIEKPEITITKDIQDNGKLLIVYKDNAGGLQNISPEEVFEPYISTKTKESGTGIGLYLARSIIKKTFNGSISVENIDNGVAFYIELKV